MPEDDFMKVNYSRLNNFPVFIRIVVHHENLTKVIIPEIVSYLYQTYESLVEV